MRAFLLLALVPLFALSGCLESSVTTEDDAGGSHSSSVSCVNGNCRVCADDECAPCAEGECEECRDGDCPAFDRAREAAANAVPPKDVDIQQTYPLTTGLAETSWSFDVAEGATGHVQLFVRDQATGDMELMGSSCVSYEWSNDAGSYSNGRQGSCGGSNIGVSGSTNTSPHYYLSWDSLEAGHYTIAASTSQPQANELVVDIVVDNP